MPGLTEASRMHTANLQRVLAMNTIGFTNLFVLISLTSRFASGLNDKPIIGIVAEESPDEELQYGQSFFHLSYVNYLEMAGARVVPVMIFQDESYYEDLVKKINGVLFPGGGVNILTSGYAKAAQQIFKFAKQMNDAGDYFPLWGTCLGHELMTALVTRKNLLSSTDAYDHMLPLNLTAEAKQSRLLGNAPDDVLKIVTSWNVTANFHHYGLTPKNFSENEDLRNFFNVLSTNVDINGKTFISTMEGKKYPFYTSQWHPEANVYRWDIEKYVNHSAGAIRVSQYFADFFISEARKSDHHFPDVESESKQLIYNYIPTFMGLPTYEVNYYFNYSHVSEEDTIQERSYWNRAMEACSYHARYIHGVALLWYVLVLPVIMFLFCGTKRQQVAIPHDPYPEKEDTGTYKKFP